MDSHGWLCYLRALCSLGVAATQQIDQESSLDDLRELVLSEFKVKEAVGVYCDRLRGGPVILDGSQ